MNTRRTRLIFATLAVCLVCIPSLVLSRSSFTDYNDVQQVLVYLTDILPPELKSSDLSARPKSWADWVVRHDRDIRGRLQRGDEDTLVSKSVPIGESKTLQVRLDATNILNHPLLGNPTLDINSTTPFGSITSKGTQRRQFKAQVRLNF